MGFNFYKERARAKHFLPLNAKAIHAYAAHFFSNLTRPIPGSDLSIPNYNANGPLPDEVTLLIMAELPMKSVLAMRATCRAFQRVAEDDSIWINIFYPNQNRLASNIFSKFRREKYEAYCSKRLKVRVNSKGKRFTSLFQRAIGRMSLYAEKPMRVVKKLLPKREPKS